MTEDMMKKLKNCFFKKCQFLHFLLKLKVKKCFLKKQLFSILIISLVIFDLQKRTIPQIKALNILFWPYFIHFIARMDIWWAMKPRKCPVFFAPDFIITYWLNSMSTKDYIFRIKSILTLDIQSWTFTYILLPDKY